MFFPQKNSPQTMTEQFHYRDGYVAVELLIRRSILLHVDMQFFPLFAVVLSNPKSQSHNAKNRRDSNAMKKFFTYTRFLLLQNFIPGRKSRTISRRDHVWHSPDEGWCSLLLYSTQIRLLLSRLEHRISAKYFRFLRRCFAFFRSLERA